jgi:hypothetical protein
MGPVGGAVPVPAKGTVWGLPVILWVKFSKALRFPVAEGENVTLTAQVAFGATVAPEHESALLAKSLAFVPLIATLNRVRLAVPVFVTVSIWAALIVPVGSLANTKLAAEKLAPGAPVVPVPAKATVWGLPAPL